ncbi:unnamed protein product [Thelazia callipaeda]|uniref:Protein kinase domain-containing protein n=1 Tax=Thelazia callipaeda TaxID=103827 RepID=A0A158RC58_THECL|nr:unnamed protein product [Thelazia callipaeda]
MGSECTLDNTCLTRPSESFSVSHSASTDPVHTNSAHDTNYNPPRGQSHMKRNTFWNHFLFGKTSGDSSTWEETLVDLVATPKMLAGFSGGEGKTVYPSKQKKEKFKKLGKNVMEMFFASVIEMVCEGDFDGQHNRLRDVLRHIAVHFIHPSYFSEECRALRIAIRKRITEALNVGSKLAIDKSIEIVMNGSNCLYKLYQLLSNLSICPAKEKNYLLPSRYNIEFEEIRKIGGGGFGSVYHVRSKIDNCDYAIKKVPVDVPTSETMMKVVNEVRLLASVQHKNIVRYFGAWVEMPGLWSSDNEDASNDEDEDTQRDSSDDESKNKVDEEDWDIQFCDVSEQLGSGEKDFVEILDPTSASNSDSCADESFLIVEQSSRNSSSCRAYGTMFVQMELCSRTLQDYFFQRMDEVSPKIDREWNRSIMEQLISAVTHLHSKKIIHRDIKPSNIFLREDKSCSVPTILLGDFGLACLHETKTSCSGTATNFIDDNVITHSGGVGTTLYAAPEQRSTVYDSAVDIYSAGIVFFELFFPFSTQMERASVITKLKAEKLDENFFASFPEEHCEFCIQILFIENSVSEQRSYCEMVGVM